MKYKLLFLIPLNLISISAIKREMITNASMSMTFDNIGPLVEYNQDITISAKLSVTKTFSSVRERLSLGTDDEEGYTYFNTTASHSITSRRSRTITFTLPLSTMFSEHGIYGQVDVLDSSSEIIISRPFYLRPAVPRTIKVQNYLSRYYTVNDVIINITNYDLYHQEKYMFSDFLDYFNVDNYYRLDLSRLKITYDCFAVFPGGNASLHFVDYNHLFPDLDDNSSVPEFDIPLTISQKKTTICFDFPKIMYVNPKTLSMSLVAKPDYLTTKYFYLPVNKKEQLLDQLFTLRVTDFGYGKTSFNWNVRYLNNRGLVGDCTDSDYCVVGEVV